MSTSHDFIKPVRSIQNGHTRHLANKNRLYLDIADSTSSCHEENLWKRGKSSGMSNHTLSECPPTPLKPKPL